jgi:hypothetical protein
MLDSSLEMTTHEPLYDGAIAGKAG